MYNKNKYNKACRRNGMRHSSPTSQASSFVVVVSVANGDDDLCHNHQMLWHVWKVSIDVPCRQHDMMLSWWVLVGLLWLETWHRGIVFVWLVCRQWQLGRALSVEMRYGGVCDLWWPSLLAHFPGIIVRGCCCCCGQQQWLVPSFLSSLVSSVCAGVVVRGQTMVAGGGSQWRRRC